MKRKYIALPVLIILMLLASTIIVSAMTGGDFSLPWTTSDGGGATFSSGGGYSLGGTIGQPDAGQHTGGDFGLSGGFWVQPPPVEPNTLPSTGFSPNRITKPSSQPKEKSYIAHSDLWLEIPKLNLALDIVEVPIVNDTWDVSWLGEQAGYLAGTAFPTWEGNTVITAHVWDANNNPGPFIGLKTLGYGDRIIIHAFGQSYTYEIRQSLRITPGKVEQVLTHEEYDWVTLLTCESYFPRGDTYLLRRAVKAVLIEVREE